MGGIAQCERLLHRRIIKDPPRPLAGRLHRIGSPWQRQQRLILVTGVELDPLYVFPAGQFILIDRIAARHLLSLCPRFQHMHVKLADGTEDRHGHFLPRRRICQLKPQLIPIAAGLVDAAANETLSFAVDRLFLLIDQSERIPVQRQSFQIDLCRVVGKDQRAIHVSAAAHRNAGHDLLSVFYVKTVIFMNSQPKSGRHG